MTSPDGSIAPPALGRHASGAEPDARSPEIPAYLREVYAWAYIRPRSVALLDLWIVVSTILWGNYGRLVGAALAELRPGQRVLQPACVYGDLSPRIAALLGPQGRLDVGDVVPIQVENCRRKLEAFATASVALRNAAEPVPARYDVACCFFLLHEMPEHYKHRVVDTMLGAVRPGGKAVFVDYHRPHWAHPLKGVTSLVFDLLEPFAKGLWARDIRDYASDGTNFTWRKHAYFGGLFQKVVAQRRA